MSGQSPEVVLAQEQGTTMRKAGAAKEVEAEFGLDETEGTLILTNKRLVFACTDEKEEDLPGENALNPTGKIRLVYSEVEDIDHVPTEPPNIFIQIPSISSIKGHAETIGRPSLEVGWSDAKGRHVLVFTEEMAKRRGKNLNDWAAIIENLKDGKQKLITIRPPPSVDTLEGKIARVLSDMQEKGVLEIEDLVETEFKTELGPDEVQAACDKLASQGFLKRYPDSTGDTFYRRASPLGEDDLSS